VKGQTDTQTHAEMHTQMDRQPDVLMPLAPVSGGSIKIKMWLQ